MRLPTIVVMRRLARRTALQRLQQLKHICHKFFAPQQGRENKRREAELTLVLNRVLLEAVSTITRDEVQRVFESMCDDYRGSNVHCAKEAAR